MFGRDRSRQRGTARRRGSLADLRPGSQADIVSVDDRAGAAARRLGALGFVPGVTVEVVRRAPLADPVIYRTQEGEISLRRVDAARIRVRER